MASEDAFKSHSQGLDVDVLPGAAPAHDGACPTDIPSLPALVCDAIVRAAPAQRANLLSRLLVAVGPLALAVIANGAFAKYLAKARWNQLAVSVDDATAATWGQVLDVVQYVAQSDPRLVQQLWALLSTNAATLTAAGAAITAFAISRLAHRAAASDEPEVVHPDRLIP